MSVGPMGWRLRGCAGGGSLSSNIALFLKGKVLVFFVFFFVFFLVGIPICTYEKVFFFFYNMGKNDAMRKNNNLKKKRLAKGKLSNLY